MILSLPGLAYGTILILAASRELHTKGAPPLTAIMTLGLSLLDPLWQAVETLVARLNPFDQPDFDRRNPVHRVAGLLLIAQSTSIVWQGILIRSDIDRTFFAPTLSGLLQSMAMMVMIYISLSVLGTGWGHRRDLGNVAQRLGLRLPTFGDCFTGLACGILIFVGMTVATLIVLLSPSAADYSVQMDGSRQLFDVVKGSLPAALLVAVLAGTGEEILFRGALQPVFGILVSSLFFTIVHIQYGLSPATLILFFVSLGMGLVRKRYSTTAAIIAHATYDFMPFLLYTLLPT